VRRLGQLFLKHRQRLAPLVVLIGLIVIGGIIFEASPRETEIRYDLGPSHRDIETARIAYLLDGDEVLGARFRFDDGAPEALRHTVELSPGRYEVKAELRGRAVSRDLSRVIRLPADGVVRVDVGGDP
jgi:hypothetical protein